MSRENSIEGVVDRIVYNNEENGWTVARLVVRGKGEVTAVGHLPGIQAGENLRLSGRWVNDRKFGKQFRAESFLTIQPNTFIGIEKYLGSGLIQGIGPEIARRLVQHFGLDTLDVIDRQPQRLAEVEGIGKVRSSRIREAWQEQREIKDVMVFLQSYGVSTAFALKIYKRFGQDAVRAVRDDPYRLAREIYGIGFRTADRIAQSLGIPLASPRRAAAGILHTLRRATDTGHTYLPREMLIAESSDLLATDREMVPREILEQAVDELVREGDLIAEPLTGTQPPDPSQTAIFPVALAVAERGLAGLLRQLGSQHLLPLRIDVARALEWYEAREDLQLARQQRQALERALTVKVLVITGGPGTGKTTLVKGIVQILTKKGLRVLLAAPTGRAAKRLGEATGGEARTLHRLLEFSPQERTFARGPDNPLPVDLLVIDEASMLDTTLAYHVMKALPPAARLVLVGDVDQLPSIGPGRILADLIESKTLEVTRLSEIFRQARESLIVVNAHRVRAAELPTTSLRPDGDFFLIEREDPEALLATLKRLVAEKIPQTFGFDPMRDIQILTPMRRGLLGANHLNAELQALLNPEGAAIPNAGHLLRIGDRVMQRRNNYDLEVWNGDTGKVIAHDELAEKIRIDFDGREVSYERQELDEVVLAYACSIHKSQGSEYPCVVIPLHTQHFTLLQRNLLYTAITRGRRLVILVASRRALQLAVETETSTRRRTLLIERLRGEL